MAQWLNRTHSLKLLGKNSLFWLFLPLIFIFRHFPQPPDTILQRPVLVVSGLPDVAFVPLCAEGVFIQAAVVPFSIDMINEVSIDIRPLLLELGQIIQWIPGIQISHNE